jgi:hypothetical protein
MNRLIIDLARMCSLSYKPSDLLHSGYCNDRPYNKGCTECAFLRLKEEPVLHSTDEDCQVMVGKDIDDETLIVAFRGTESKDDIFTDLKINRVMLPLFRMPDELCPLIHSGFYEQFFSVNKYLEEDIKEKDKIVFTGHSLGGALATIGSLYYSFQYPEKDISCVTFGSPRVGDDRFAYYFNDRVTNSYRYVNDNDPVPCLPTRWRFKHVDGLQWLNQDVVQEEIQVWRFYRFVKNTLLSIIGYGYNALDDHKCDNYVDDLKCILKEE